MSDRREPEVTNINVAVNHPDVVFAQIRGSRWADYAKAPTGGALHI
jgi:hypothetical protein